MPVKLKQLMKDIETIKEMTAWYVNNPTVYLESEIQDLLNKRTLDICKFILNLKYQSMKTEMDRDCLVKNIERKFLNKK